MIHVFTLFVCGVLLASAAARDELVSRRLHPKPGPAVRRQLSNFNDLEFHSHSRFYAKTLNFGETTTIVNDDGPFVVKFTCTTTGATFNMTISNNNDYPISYHGTYQGGTQDAAILAAGQSATLQLASITPSGSGNSVSTGAKGAVLTSTGYYLGVENSESFILSISTDDGDGEMPNSDCSVAGTMTYAHPHHGGYYEGLLSESLNLGSSGQQAVMVFGGVVFGMLTGALVLAGITLLFVKNRSLFLHSIGYYESLVGGCMEDSSWDGVTNPTHCFSTQSEHCDQAAAAADRRRTQEEESKL
ncbi:unnamed protein product [Symbiodinium microadriaticum]|nr:unnamed protein product [Symbiodinium microadriaticum]